MRRSLELVLAAVNGALYAVVGFLTYLGIFAPVFGTVRFWPSVVIPAVFSLVYGPRVGALGAGIGIFISDMMIHGNALLSLTVGVPANVIGFWLVGALRDMRPSRGLGAAVALLLAQLGLVAATVMAGYLGWEEGVVFASSGVVSLVAVAAVYLREREMTGPVAACAVGLTAGSLIIGVGLWAFSHFQPLPWGASNAPLHAIVVWFIWTFLSEFVFMALLVPPLLVVVRKAGIRP